MAGKTWVVLLTDAFGTVGGIPAFNRELVEAFRSIARERGWTLKIFALNDRPSPRGEGYEYHAFGGNRWRFVLESLRAARRADDVLFGHVHLSPLALLVPRARRWMVAHGIEVWGPLGRLRRRGLGRMDRVLCVSRFTRDRLMERHRVPEEKTLLFPNTARVSPSDKNGCGRPAEWGASRIIFTLSRLWPEERYKKIDRVIEAMPSVLKSVPDALYVIAGEGGDRPRLERLARDLGVGERVIFTGALSEEQVKACYEACEMFVLPSLGEGFGIVFLEAMACGKPCVGAAAGGVPEVILDGRTGILVQPDHAGSVAEALVRLLQDDTRRHSMGRAGRERFVSEYAPDRFRERLVRLTDRAS
jgi:glycosyltransferase involved in cell wall biosynthesis